MNRSVAQDMIMAFSSQRKRYDGSHDLRFDRHYRVAQLPLVDSNHPLALNVDSDKNYRYGHREAKQSMIIPIDGDALFESQNLKDFVHRISNTSVGRKICWDMKRIRHEKLHATICGFSSQSALPKLPFETIQGIHAFSFELRGLFMGNFNTGRIYICLYPECEEDTPITDRITDAIGIPANRLLLCGFLNLKEELTATEAKVLDELCSAASSIVFGSQVCEELIILESTDDLVLNSRIVDRLELRTC